MAMQLAAFGEVGEAWHGGRSGTHNLKIVDGFLYVDGPGSDLKINSSKTKH